MKRYIRDGIVKYQNEIVVYADDMQVFNPSEELLLEWGWKEYTIQELNDEQKLISAKMNKLYDIEMYDKSEGVNSFFVGDIQAWIDRDTRVSLMNSTSILKELGYETTTLWLNKNPFTINCEQLIQMLKGLEVYALQCYNVTEQHKSNVDNLLTIDEVNEYDYTLNYPEKIRIEL